MDVYLVRHGESEYNIGATENLDSPLTPLGEQQAARTALRLADVGLTQVCVSPFRRTLLTAGPICAATHLKADIFSEICEYFSEDNPGYQTFTGLDTETIQHDFPWATVGSAFPLPSAWCPFPLENGRALIARAERARDTLWSRYGATNAQILLISHADTVGRLTEAFLRVQPYPASPPWVENCSVTLLHCGSDSSQPATLRYANDISHLVGLKP
jgi:broad specificity phosphatase PhoE